MSNPQSPQQWPCLTFTLPGCGGHLKTHPHDFIVEEQPLYHPTGQGTHSYLYLEKTGRSTAEAIAQIAQALNRKPRDIGYAGQKDSQAVTRQWISIEHVTPTALSTLRDLDCPGLRILDISCHGNKLRLGHLRGNRFQIRLRHLDVPLEEAESRTKAIMTALQQRGVPNYFGLQRFGQRQDNHHLGEAILTQQHEAFVDRFLGDPTPMDSPDIHRARSAYEADDFVSAQANWPASFRDERRVLRELIMTKGNKRRAFRVLDGRKQQFFVSAYQSFLFNKVLAQRLDSIDRILVGDIAMKHTNGACFVVEDADQEQQRCQNFEISPTGPLLGPRMAAVTGAAAVIENKVLDPIRPEAEENETTARHLGRGGRRALRFLPRDVDILTGQDDSGDYLQLSFELDPGCYATTLLAEVTKT